MVNDPSQELSCTQASNFLNLGDLTDLVLQRVVNLTQGAPLCPLAFVGVVILTF